MATSRNYWPLGIIAAFVLLISGLAVVVVIAETHRDTLVSENYYEQELNYQSQIDAAARAKEAGATLRFDAATGKLVITVPAQQLAQNFSGKIAFSRADSPKLDREFLLEPKRDGTQNLSVSEFTAGSWQARVTWNAAGKAYLLEEKIAVTR